MSQNIPVYSPSTQTLLKQYNAEKQLEEAHRSGVRILSLDDPEYPPLLRQIPAPPPFLFVKGTLSPSSRNVACVGTRHPTTWGITVTQRITQMLVQQGFSIISGLAIGVDAIAHNTALQAGGHTIGVLPCGFDFLYPRCHRELADQIIEQGGALLSEQPFGSRLQPDMFLRRNRIISGMSLGTVVMQCMITGGTLHTARGCLRQQRLLCVASPQGKYAQEPRSQGNIALLQHPEAFPLRSCADYPALIQQLKQLQSPQHLATAA